MAANRNWGLITTGATFEGLVTTLVFFKDPHAALLGRAGRDGGQDIRSGKGTLVYQAKHHQVPTAAKATKDAKAEAIKIEKYQQPSHPRCDQWSKVEAWCLCTNASFNTTDQALWDSEIVPLYANLGLKADFWERATLDGLLDKYPEVDRSYFENENRVVLALPEVRNRLELEPDFVLRGNEAAFRGRVSEMKAFDDFMSSEAPFAVVHGPGGIGKSRFLLEAGYRFAETGDWQVLWANVASMERSSAWFDAIVPECSTLLLVDEPETEPVLGTLIEQVATSGRLGKWKVAVATRSPKDPVMRAFSNPKVRPLVVQLPLGRIPESDASQVCQDLLDSGPLAASTGVEWRTKAAADLAKRFSAHPVWLGLAVQVLEETGDLNAVPDTAAELVDLYVNEILHAQAEHPPDQVRDAIRWVALLQPLNREDTSVLKTVSAEIEVPNEGRALQLLARLVERRVLVQRGARQRLVELKPDVVRDHVLRTWLTLDRGFGDPRFVPSAVAGQLVKAVLSAARQGHVSTQVRAILVSLARTEVMLRGTAAPVDLLAPLFRGLLDSVSEITATSRIQVAELLSQIAEARPEDAVAVAQAFRTHQAPDETLSTIFGDRITQQSDVVLSLAWLVYHAGMGARTPAERKAVLAELFTLALEESRIGRARPRGLPNDGKRGKQLLEQTLHGGPSFWSPFDAEAVEVALGWLSEAGSRPLDADEVTAVEALVKPAVAVDRSQNWSAGDTIHFRNYIIIPGLPAWDSRSDLLDRIREILATDVTPASSRLWLWRIFASAHHGLLRGRKDAGKYQGLFERELVADLEWARATLSAREITLEELEAARTLWEWHLHFDKVEQRRELAEHLEAIYTANDLAAEFGPLKTKDPEVWRQRGPWAESKAADLAALGSPSAIRDFVARAEAFLGGSDQIRQVLGVAAALGAKAPGNGAIRDFIREALAQTSDSSLVVFAAAAAGRWIWAVRSDAPNDAAPLFESLVAACGAAENQVFLARGTYGNVPVPTPARSPSSAELEALISLRQVFLDQGLGPAFIEAVGWMIDIDWNRIKQVVERTLPAVPDDAKPLAVGALADAVYWGVRDATDEGRATPEDAGIWLLNQVLAATGRPSANDMTTWHVEEVLKRSSKPDVRWLVSRLEALDASGKASPFISHRNSLSRYVEPPSAEDRQREEIAMAIERLLELTAGPNSVAHLLPTILGRLDPAGDWVPVEVAKRARTVNDVDTARRLARVASRYDLRSKPWREIALPIARFANGTPKRDQGGIFYALTDRRPPIWSSGIFEVPQHLVDRAREAEELLAAEQDATLIPLWTWYVADTAREVEDETERAREERGE